MEEIYFWKKRSIYLTPLSKEANQKNGDVQWTIRVLSMISSTSGEKLREACASLRRLSVEATWNSKYLTILEKPFKALAKGPLKNVYTSIPGMVKTLKMVAASSQSVQQKNSARHASYRQIFLLLHHFLEQHR